MSPANPAKLSIGTILIHADADETESSVAPAISVTTTFKHNEGVELDNLDFANPLQHVYARLTTPNSVRVEKVLSQIIGGHAITYRSGLSAATAAIVHYKPRRVAITKGYMGMFHILDIYKRSAKDLEVIDLNDEYQEGDLAWVETPLNPTGEARDIKYYADKVHAVGGRLVVDSTFGPPPLQDPFLHGADCILHSGTKYLGGHSDLLAGVLSVKDIDEWNELFFERIHNGSILGSLEAWLLLRSLRTLHLRVPCQSESATHLAQWLHSLIGVPVGQEFDGVPGGVVVEVFHGSLQGINENGFDPKIQMPGGFSPTFAIHLRNPEHASRLPFAVKLFTPATSLGSVESLIEQRHAVDPKEDPRLVRLSIGVEGVEDLKEDLRQALNKVSLGAEPKV